MPAQPRAVSLDIWGTLLGSDPQFKPARNGLLRRRFAPDCSDERFDEVMRTADRAADRQCMTDGRDIGFVERVELALRHLGVTGQDVAGARLELMGEQGWLARRHPPHPLHPSLPDEVARVARRVPVVLTSNTGMLPGALMRDLLRLAGFHGDVDYVFSDEVGWAKPDPRIFAEVWRVLGDHGVTSTQRVIHVGDHPVADGDGARRAGLHPVLVHPDGLGALQALQQVADRAAAS